MPGPCPALRALCPEFLEHQDEIIPGRPNKDRSKPYALNINAVALFPVKEPIDTRFREDYKAPLADIKFNSRG
jgi:hypothetical protein